MRGRTIGIIAGAAVLWTVAPLSASATGCEANVDTSIAVPGDKSASADGACAVSSGPGVVVGASAEQQGDHVVHEDSVSVDADGDGQDDARNEGHGGSSCPPPEEQSPIGQVVCPVLQAT